MNLGGGHVHKIPDSKMKQLLVAMATASNDRLRQALSSRDAASGPDRENKAAQEVSKALELKRVVLDIQRTLRLDVRVDEFTREHADLLSQLNADLSHFDLVEDRATSLRTVLPSGASGSGGAAQYELTVHGLAEKRPSVMVGDQVRVNMMGSPQKAWRGRAVSVNQEQVRHVSSSHRYVGYDTNCYGRSVSTKSRRRQ